MILLKIMPYWQMLGCGALAALGIAVLIAMGIGNHIKKSHAQHIGFGWMLGWDAATQEVIVRATVYQSPARLAGIQDDAVVVTYNGQKLSFPHKKAFVDFFNSQTQRIVGDAGIFEIQEDWMTYPVTMQASVIRDEHVPQTERVPGEYTLLD